MYETGLLADFCKNWHFHFASEKCPSFKPLPQFLETKNENSKKLCTRRKTILIFPNKSSGFTGKLYYIHHGQ